MVFQAITGAQTPACLFAASDPVETVTPPTGKPCDTFIIALFMNTAARPAVPPVQARTVTRAF